MGKTFYDNVLAVFEGGGDDLASRLKEIEKSLEKMLIVSVYAPSALTKRDKIDSGRKRNINKIASETKSALKGTTDTFDQAIKGQWSTAIKTAVKEKSNKYDPI